MAENIIVSIFNVESEGYQALTELRELPRKDEALLFQAALVKKEDGAIKMIDGFDNGILTTGDTALGGLIGACLGVLGGPVGMLLAGGYGMILGNAVGTGQALDQVSMIEQIAGKIQDKDLAIVALAKEDDESILDGAFEKFDTIILRYDAAFAAQEVVEAQMMEAEMARMARAEFRREKSAEFKSKVEAFKEEFKKAFQNISPDEPE